MAEWLLVETFGGAGPSLIAIGRSPKPFVPLRKVLRNPRSLALAATAIDEVLHTGAAIDRHSDSGERSVHARPLTVDGTRTHGVYLWMGRPDEPVPTADPAGAWSWDPRAGISWRSADLLDLYGVAPERRTVESSIAGAFARMLTNRDEGEALAKIVRPAPGAEHQGLWTVQRDDNMLRAAHFSFRIVEDRRSQGGPGIVLRGITHDIGPAEQTPAAPVPLALEYTVLAASTEAGEYRAIVNPRTLNLIRWVGDPMPGLAWDRLPGEPVPAIHPADLPVAREMARGLARGRTRGVVRVRAADGGWRALDVRASALALNRHTKAGLVTVTTAETNECAAGSSEAG
jgi:hypothetical protein